MYLELAYNFETVVLSAATSDCIIFTSINPLMLLCSLALLFYGFLLLYSDEF
jgi:hypothetical protein